MTKLALLRHGRTDWNRAGRIQGRSDIPLDDDARAELSVQRLPPPWDTAELWSSPLDRAVETARLVARREPQVTPDLTEMFWGDWEGRRGVDLLAEPDSGFRHIEEWGWEYCPPGGESPGHVRVRTDRWLSTVRRDTVAVCHIGIMRVILARFHNWNFDGPAPFRIKRNRLFVIDLESGTPQNEPVRLITADLAS
ncbi:MAG: histidine phosphatase family protein [Pseudomonadota bacterium]